MSILEGVEDKRNFKVPAGKEFVLSNGEKLSTLDQLSEAINLIEPEVFHAHVNEQKNDFANWVDGVFGEHELAEQLRTHPTPLRMMVAIEKFLRQSGQSSVAASQGESEPAQTGAEPAERSEESPEQPSTMANAHHGNHDS